MIVTKVEINISKEDPSKIIAEQVEKFTRAVSDKIVEYALTNLRNNESWLTGRLAQSGRVEFDKALMEGTIIFSAPYAAYVEYGTAPHVAPLGPSLPHTSKNGIIKITSTPSANTNPLDFYAWRKGEREAIGTKYGVHTALGFGIWKSIMRKGTKAHPFLRPAIDKVKSQMKQIAAEFGLELE